MEVILKKSIECYDINLNYNNHVQETKHSYDKIKEFFSWVIQSSKSLEVDQECITR